MEWYWHEAYKRFPRPQPSRVLGIRRAPHLGQSIQGEAALDGFLRFADRPLFKFAEWGLVVLLAAHMAGGVRLLLIEFGPWTGLRKNLIAASAGFAAVFGMAFALALVF
jgi:fumarate reductase subunit D